MKKFGLILAGCIAFIGIHGAYADDVGDAARAATRRDTNATTVLSRQKTTTPPMATSRNSSSNTTNIVNRNSGTNRAATVVNRAPDQNTTTTANVVARTTTVPHFQTNQNSLKTRTPRITPTRSGARMTSTRSARSATTYATRQDILTRNYSQCKEVFNSCMDEFCANKDSQLKRCACSARINDFDTVKKQLNNIDDKMLDFNQRLLTVGMDEKDVAVLNIETEGEKAFYDTKDVSESKRTLDAIAKKLNIDFDSNKFASPIGNVLSWSLDIDSAFDNIDSLRGTSTAAKSGTALYSAALPVCREMAAEICSDEDLTIAENGYQLSIDYDCDTVEKTYKTAVQQARQKILESSALLDISRLNTYQKNNSDDILTCKKKMLAMLSDPTVCGDNLGKCLDITGQYIDPSTGEAFLGPDLSDLAGLITRPEENQSWTTAPGNAVFVSFLKSKKKFLEPAMEHCQDIADTVWDAFIEDALSQIKIAQIRKLEDVRQSCTTLTAQCLSETMDSIDNFDARALSTFGVNADTTVNAMCDGVLSACTTLLNTTDIEMEWYRGMYGIQSDMTFDTIKRTCREVGEACIIQVCTSVSGNFGLCENLDTSINRKSIINRTACWDEVKSCIRSAGTDAIATIFTQNGFNNTTQTHAEWYQHTYNWDGTTYTFATSNGMGTTSDNQCIKPVSSDTTPYYCILDICYNECGGNAYIDTNECRVCRLAESIWGNCEADPTTQLKEADSHNMIQIPANSDTGTLLAWFALNTGTDGKSDNCRDTTCGPGFVAILDTTTGNIICVDSGNMTDDGEFCMAPNASFKITDSLSNCCTNGSIVNGNCCQGTASGGVCLPNGATLFATFTIPNDTTNTYYQAGNYNMYCTGTVNDTHCNGRFFIVNQSGTRYMDPQYDNTPQTQYVSETIKYDDNTTAPTYTHKYLNNSWGWYDGNNQSSTLNPTHWTVSFGQ